MENRFGGNSFLSTITFKYLAVVATVALCVIISIIMQSRAFMVGSATALLFLFFAFNRFAPKRAYLVLAILCLICLISILVFFFKTGSSSGRLLIYKVSWTIFKQHYAWGIGLDRFKRQYGLFQAAYFKAGNYSSKELLLADNTFYAFNDYWQLIIEMGIIGIVALLFYFAGITKLVLLALRRYSPYPPLLLFVVAQLITITIAALFTHVFERPYFQVITISLLATLVFFAFGHKVKIVYIVFVAAVLGLSISFRAVQFYILHYAQYRQWQEANESARIGYLTQAREMYSELYSDLKQHPLFLDNYSSLLVNTEKYPQAQSILLELISMQTQNTYYSNLGECYFKMHKIHQAEQAYLTAIYIVPNRFAPRLALYKLYRATGQLAKARRCADLLLQLPIKVPSSHVTFFLNEIKSDLMDIPPNQ